MMSTSKNKSPSPRSSPLLQFFGDGNAGKPAEGAAATRSDGHDPSVSSSGIMRSLSKCFDGGVEAVVDDGDVSIGEGNGGVSGTCSLPSCRMPNANVLAIYVNAAGHAWRRRFFTLQSILNT